MNTHEFNLCSGPKCTVKELTGKHQRMLTEQGKKSHSDRLNDVLKDVIVKIEGLPEITEDVLKEILSCDKKKILTEVRQFTLDFQPEFSFLFKYMDEEGNKQESPIEVTLNEGEFPFRSPKLADGSEMNFESYQDVLDAKKILITLPSGLDVEFTMLDGRGELIGSSTKKSERSSHTLLKMRRPVKFHQKDGGSTVPVQVNMDTLSYKDIEALRTKIKEVEGEVDTEMMFEHPEQEGRQEVLDLIGTTAFFFPSEAI